MILKPHYWLYAFGGYWFVYALFICRIMYWLIHRYIKNDLLHWILLFLGLTMSIISDFPLHFGDKEVTIPNIFFWKNAGANIIFLAIGFKYKASLFRKNILKINSFIFLALLTYFSMEGVGKITVYTMSSNILLMDIPRFLALAFLGSMFIIYISYSLKENLLLENFGKQSLLVYLAHVLYLNLYIDFTNRYLLQPDSIFTSVLFYILVAIITITSCWLTIKLFEKKQLSWVLGK